MHVCVCVFRWLSLFADNQMESSGLLLVHILMVFIVLEGYRTICKDLRARVGFLLVFVFIHFKVPLVALCFKQVSKRNKKKIS